MVFSFQERLDLDRDGFLSTGELRELPGMQGISLEVRPVVIITVVNDIIITIVNSGE